MTASTNTTLITITPAVTDWLSLWLSHFFDTGTYDNKKHKTDSCNITTCLFIEISSAVGTMSFKFITLIGLGNGFFLHPDNVSFEVILCI